MNPTRHNITRIDEILADLEAIKADCRQKRDRIRRETLADRRLDHLINERLIADCKRKTEAINGMWLVRFLDLIVKPFSR